MGKELGQCMECEKVSKNHDYFHHSAYCNPFPPHHVSAHIFKVGITLHMHFGFHCSLLFTSRIFYYKIFQTFHKVENFFLANTQTSHLDSAVTILRYFLCHVIIHVSIPLSILESLLFPGAFCDKLQTSDASL